MSVISQVPCEMAMSVGFCDHNDLFSLHFSCRKKNKKKTDDIFNKEHNFIIQSIITFCILVEQYHKTF